MDFGSETLLSWAENVMCGYADPETVVDLWFGSPAHRDNILNADLREVGVGYAWDSGNDRGYVVQDMGYTLGAAPVVIENEALSTTNRTVELYIYSPKEVLGEDSSGSAVDMRISNSPSFEDAIWEPFATQKRWTLPAGSGWRTVHVQTRDEFGHLTFAKDSIYLGPYPPLEESLDAQIPAAEEPFRLYLPLTSR
jgi:hypothetical protein